MKLEQQVISLDLAKRLKELGVKQDSSCWWYRDHIPTSHNNQEYWPGMSIDDMKWRLSITGQPSRLSTSRVESEYAAFTVAELGEMLPKYLLIDSYSCNLQIIRSAAWRFYYGEMSAASSIKFTAPSDATEVEARGLMLGYLLENDLIPRTDI